LSESVTIRQASAADSDLLSALGAETFSDAFKAYNTPEDMALYLRSSFAPEIQARELADPLSVFLIAEVAGEAVGYVRLRGGRPPADLEAHRPVEVVRLYARSPWIGRGIGAALMRASLRETQLRDYDAVWLDVWDQNRRAIDFYRSWGFAEIGRQPFRLGNDIQNDLLMARALSPSASLAVGT